MACVEIKMKYAQQREETIFDEESPDFGGILEMYRVSLQESRDRGSFVNEAATLLFIAQHCFYVAS